jgi:sugar O-acyltransferase (sialic acid O-acetyltransferase NeuD family)
MLTPLVIWGAKGHAKVLHEFAGLLGFELVALFDNDQAAKTPFPGVKLYYGEAGLREWRAAHPELAAVGLVAIGGQRGCDRLAVQQCLIRHSVQPTTVVHPAAYVATSARLSPGCQILAQAMVGADSTLGDACIINTSASVDHECRLGPGVHLAPGARLAGEVEIGAHTLIAVGAVVLPRIKIGSNCIVGAGALVTSEVADNTVVFGQPARFVRNNPPALLPHFS